MEWHSKAYKLKQDGLTYNQIADELGLTWNQVNNYFYRNKKKIIYEDQKTFNENDVEEYVKKMIDLQEAAEKLNTKQVKAVIRIPEDKPCAVAYWGDWHIGAIGTDYRRFEADLEKIVNTDGLYFIGAGDYKDNYITGSPVAGNFESVIQPGMQDLVVKHYMIKSAEKCLALVRGCHDSWDKKQGDKDFLTYLCSVIGEARGDKGPVNNWHGGEITIKVGNQSYLWRCRHKYKGKSDINLENAMRRLIEGNGECDVAAEAHLHDMYTMERTIVGKRCILMRTGSYKVIDEYGQQLGGYSGKIGVPVVVMYPNEKKAVVMKLDEAIEFLEKVRGRFND